MVSAFLFLNDKRKRTHIFENTNKHHKPKNNFIFSPHSYTRKQNLFQANAQYLPQHNQMDNKQTSIKYAHSHAALYSFDAHTPSATKVQENLPALYKNKQHYYSFIPLANNPYLAFTGHFTIFQRSISTYLIALF
jgi:hypothetical protein